MDPLSTDSDAIRRVIEAFEKSSWSEIDVRVGALRVHLRADDTAFAGSGVTTGRHEEPPARPVPAAGEGSGQPSKTADMADESTADDIPANAIVVRSPSPGIFWRSPQPGAPPFADVGQHVDSHSTLCIVEVMKLMNHVKAGIAGTVVGVFGRDGVAVGKGAPLFAVTGDSAR